MKPEQLGQYVAQNSVKPTGITEGAHNANDLGHLADTCQDARFVSGAVTTEIFQPWNDWDESCAGLKA